MAFRTPPPGWLAKITSHPDGPQINERVSTMTVKPAALTAAGKRKSIWRDEHAFQQAVFDEAEFLALEYPKARLLFAIPNGQYRPGLRMEPGLKKGVPDCHLPVARHGYHSLYIELKVAGNTTSTDQEDWIAWLTEEGHCCRVITENLEEARELLRWYLAG